MSELNSEVVTCPSCKKDTTVNNADSALPVGTMLSNRYFVGIVLGQGGFGITYKGCDTRLNKKVAIKEYYPVNLVGRYSEYSTKLSVSSGENSEIFEHERQRFIKEAQLLAEFSGDRSVVDVTDIFSENNTAYMVMDYVEGENLEAYLRHSEKMDFDTAYEMLLPMLGSLSRMHAKGLIHRDISPANIMVQPDMHVILIDFGSAREFSIDGEKSLSVILKHGYSPVEQYQSKGLQGPWTDVYALSATIYKMITKITPPSSIDCMVGNVLKKPSELGATISKEEEKVLLKGLALSQTDRYSSIQDLEEAFEKAREKRSLLKSSKKNPNKKHKAERLEKEKESARNHKEDEQIQYEATEIVDKKGVVEIPKVSEEKTGSEDSTNELPENVKESIKDRSNRKILSFVAGIVLFIIILVGTFGWTYQTSKSSIPDRNLETQLELGQKYFEEQDYEQAIEMFKEALTIDPINSSARQGLESAYSEWGAVLVSEENYVKATQVLKEAIEFYPESAGLSAQLKKAYKSWADKNEEDGNFEYAIKILKKAHELFPDEEYFMSLITSDYLSWAETYVENGDFDNKKKILEEGYEFTNDSRFISEFERLEEQKNYYMIKDYVYSNVTEGQSLLGKHLSDIFVQMGLNSEMIEKGKELIKTAKVENGTYYPSDLIEPDYDKEYCAFICVYANCVHIVYRQGGYYYSLDAYGDSKGDSNIVYVYIEKILTAAVEDRQKKVLAEYGDHSKIYH